MHDNDAALRLIYSSGAWWFTWRPLTETTVKVRSMEGTDWVFQFDPPTYQSFEAFGDVIAEFQRLCDEWIKDYDEVPER